MKIIVLNGSPKGEISATMQYVKYLSNRFETHTFEIVSIAQGITKLEKNERAWGELMDKVQDADAVLWAFPLYILNVHGSYKRFIELIYEHGSMDAFSSKYTAALSTSIKYFDYTAHEYIHGICDDLGMNYCGYFSAKMNDLLEETERRRLEQFFGELVAMKQSNEVTARTYQPLDYSGCIDYEHTAVTSKTHLGEKRAVIVTDAMDSGSCQTQMILHMQRSFEPQADIIDISQISIKGGCLGCLRCGYNNECAYDGRDDVRPTYAKINEYDIIVFAGQIKDRYLSSLWKHFYDRRFFTTHQPFFNGKQMGFLITGPLSQLPYMSHALTAYEQTYDNNISGIVTNEAESSKQISAQIEGLAQRMERQAQSGYVQSMPGSAAAGRTVFRDHMWGDLRFIFYGDYKYYKKHNWFDFPQKKWRVRVTNLIMTSLLRLKFFRKYMQDNMRKLVVRELEPVANQQASK